MQPRKCLMGCLNTKKRIVFCFPKDPERRQTWLKIINMEHVKTLHIYMCGKHFSSTQRASRNLRATAVPDLKLKPDECLTDDDEIDIDSKILMRQKDLLNQNKKILNWFCGDEGSSSSSSDSSEDSIGPLQNLKKKGTGTPDKKKKDIASINKTDSLKVEEFSSDDEKGKESKILENLLKNEDLKSEKGLSDDEKIKNVASITKKENLKVEECSSEDESSSEIENLNAVECFYSGESDGDDGSSTTTEATQEEQPINLSVASNEQIDPLVSPTKKVSEAKILKDLKKEDIVVDEELFADEIVDENVIEDGGYNDKDDSESAIDMSCDDEDYKPEKSKRRTRSSKITKVTKATKSTKTSKISKTTKISKKEIDAPSTDTKTRRSKKATVSTADSEAKAKTNTKTVNLLENDDDDRPTKIHYKKTEPEKMYKFFALLKEQPLLWHKRRHGPTLYDEESKKFIAKYDNTMSILDFRSSMDHVRYLYQRYMTPKPGTKRRLESNEQLKSYLKNICEIDELSKPCAHTCDLCEFYFFEADRLSTHKYLKHDIGNLPFACSCGLHFEEESQKDAHEKSHEPKATFICEHCGVSFISNRLLQNHMNISHVDVIKNPYPYKCKKCDARFTNTGSRNDHYLKHDPPKFGCEKCGQKFYKSFVFKQHMKIHFDQRDFVCPECGNKFVEKRQLQVHRRRIHNIGGYLCISCNIFFATEKTYLAHNQRVHPNGNSMTPISEQFNKSGLPRKRRSCCSLKKRTFTCQQCAMVFDVQADLMRHKRNLGHTRGERHYKCPYCQSICRTRQTIVSHLRIVHQKPFQFSEVRNLESYISPGEPPLIDEQNSSTSDVTTKIETSVIQPLIPKTTTTPTTPTKRARREPKTKQKRFKHFQANENVNIASVMEPNDIQRLFEELSKQNRLV